jgi:hypothetical protein
MARAGRTLARVGSCTELLATPEKAFPAVNARRANDNAAASAGLIQKNRELKQRRRATIFRLGVFVRFGCIRTRRGSDLIGHPSAILVLPAAVKRMPP